MTGTVPKALTVAVVLGLLALTPAAAPALDSQLRNGPSRTSTSPASPHNGGYYIEFRAGYIGTYGHSYVVYGSNNGRPNYADLHPMGGYPGMAIGHVVPVPANTEWNPDVLKLAIAERYRVGLNATQYQKLLAAVKHARANKSPYWNAVLNNCNTYIGQFAKAIGLRVPMDFQVSPAFVANLREINESDHPSTTTRAEKRSGAAQTASP
jgi:hypothetical protein